MPIHPAPAAYLSQQSLHDLNRLIRLAFARKHSPARDALLTQQPGLWDFLVDYTLTTRPPLRLENGPHGDELPTLLPFLHYMSFLLHYVQQRVLHWQAALPTQQATMRLMADPLIISTLLVGSPTDIRQLFLHLTAQGTTAGFVPAAPAPAAMVQIIQQNLEVHDRTKIIWMNAYLHTDPRQTDAVCFLVRSLHAHLQETLTPRQLWQQHYAEAISPAAEHQFRPMLDQPLLRFEAVQQIEHLAPQITRLNTFAAQTQRYSQRFARGTGISGLLFVAAVLLARFFEWWLLDGILMLAAIAVFSFALLWLAALILHQIDVYYS